MRAVAILFALSHLFAPLAVQADAEARQGDSWVRITARPCSDPEVLQHMPDKAAHLDYRAASGRFNGTEYAACWRPHGAGIWLLWSDGDAGFVPQQALKPVTGV